MRKLLIAVLMLGLLGACHRSAPRAEPASWHDALGGAVPSPASRSDGAEG
ncbi:hypothetical protein SAMN04488038_105263 [Solimonas aquatica]|uniref:Lipoprotein n=1 Tax=Solimonas aquatica TaxID=489703 RepID=A0A1H9F787_9GAMM|nr:hypothetical protein [Solimonas aquatica]SEQ33303.1 hypothetical protein SAMN04488038_105263 [Solimonas aquatica]